MAEKRDRVFSSPTGRTPRRGTKRRALREAGQSAVQHEPRELDLSASGASVRPRSPLATAPSASTQQPSCWSEEETKAHWFIFGRRTKAVKGHWYTRCVL